MNDLLNCETPWGAVRITREKRSGLPTVWGSTRAALYWGQGWIQARDRQIQTFLVRAIFTGRMAELIKASPDFIEIDGWMRRYRFSSDPEQELARLSETHREYVEAHADGINTASRKRVWELKAAGFVPEPWTAADTLAIARGFGFVGLGDGLAVLEKWLVEMLNGGISLDQLRELFPGMEDPDYTELYRKLTIDTPVIPAELKWLKALPEFKCSNNWVIGPDRSETGAALGAGDPHLDTDRYPAIWQEIRLECPSTDQGYAARSFVGVNLPGLPGALIGRTRELFWAPTYSFLDVVDYRIEEVRNGKYRRGESDWHDFHPRTEIIRLKGGGFTERTFYENENGILCGDPARDGFYLIENYSCFENTGSGDLAGVFGLLEALDTRQGMTCAARLTASSFNWLFADSSGHIGYQMSGRQFRRPEGSSGLLPLPAWEERWNYRGYLEGDILPSAYDPPEGYLVSANDDRNAWGKTRPCAVSMGDYRYRRIREWITGRKKWSAPAMKEIQTDLVSPQAEAFIKRFGTRIPAGATGDFLKRWDFRYEPDSGAAVMFEVFYQRLLYHTFGKKYWGQKVFDRIVGETALLIVYFQYFDRILLSRTDTRWFTRKEVDQAVDQAFAEALKTPVYPLKYARRLKMNHILFGGVFPRFMGFDGGPASFPGSRSSIWQGQSFSVSGRASSFCPSYRILTDMGKEDLWTALPGGSTDRRYSRYYRNGLKAFLKGQYRKRTLSGDE